MSIPDVYKRQVVGRIVTPEAAEAVIANGSADIIGLGRSLLTDPDVYKRQREYLFADSYSFRGQVHF